MGPVKTRRLAAMQKQQRAKAGKKPPLPNSRQPKWMSNAAGTGPAKPLKNGPFVGPVPKSSEKMASFGAFDDWNCEDFSSCDDRQLSNRMILKGGRIGDCTPNQ